MGQPLKVGADHSVLQHKQPLAYRESSLYVPLLSTRISDGNLLIENFSTRYFCGKTATLIQYWQLSRGPLFISTAKLQTGHVAPQNHEIVLSCSNQKPFNFLIWGTYFKTWTANDCEVMATAWLITPRLVELLGKIPTETTFSEWFISCAAFLPDSNYKFFHNVEWNFGPCLRFFVNFLTLWRNSSYGHPPTPRKFPPFSPPPPRNFHWPSVGEGGVWIFSGTAQYLNWQQLLMLDVIWEISVEHVSIKKYFETDLKIKIQNCFKLWQRQPKVVENSVLKTAFIRSNFKIFFNCNMKNLCLICTMKLITNATTWLPVDSVWLTNNIPGTDIKSLLPDWLTVCLSRLWN